MVLKVVRPRYVAEILLRPGLANRKPGAAEAAALMPALGLLVERLNEYVLEHPAETPKVLAVPPTVTKEPDHEEPKSDRREAPAEGWRRSRYSRPQEPSHQPAQTVLGHARLRIVRAQRPSWRGRRAA